MTYNWTAIVLFLFLLLRLDCNAQNNIGLYYHPTIDYFGEGLYTHNYSIGLTSNIKLNGKFSIKPGLGYEYQKIDPWYGLVFEMQPDFYYAKLIKLDGLFAYNLTKTDKRVALYTFAGPVVNFSFYEEVAFRKTSKTRWHNTLFAAGLGCRFNIKAITINIDPTFEAQLWDNYNNLARDYNYHFGISFRTVYNFMVKKKNIK